MPSSPLAAGIVWALGLVLAIALMPPVPAGARR
jgi:hypothetical protein